MGSGKFLTKRIRVINQLGVHARPAARLAQAAQNFDSIIHIASSDKEVDAKSILDILELAAPFGSELEIMARGDDAEQAINHISSLFEQRFGEDR